MILYYQIPNSFLLHKIIMEKYLLEMGLLGSKCQNIVNQLETEKILHADAKLCISAVSLRPYLNKWRLAQLEKPYQLY